MAAIKTSTTNSFTSKQYIFAHFDDEEVNKVLHTLENEYLKNMRDILRVDLQKVIDQIKAFQKSRGMRQKLSVTISQERSPYRPAVSVRAQTIQREVIIDKNAAIFVWHTRVSDKDSDS